MQTATGTKDKIAQHWIDILLKKSREMKSTNPSRLSENIAEELRGWLKSQPGDKINPLLSISGMTPYECHYLLVFQPLTIPHLGLDPTQDTPVEILHTILLGIVKYVWHIINIHWSDDDRTKFAIRLQSTDLDGLTVPPLRAGYIIQYRNGLIGKHFKTLMQTMAFHVHGLVTDEEFELIKAVGVLGALLWVHEIDDMNKYLVSRSLTVPKLCRVNGCTFGREIWKFSSEMFSMPLEMLIPLKLLSK